MSNFFSIGELTILAAIENSPTNSTQKWNDSRLDAIKRKIKNHYLDSGDEQCCYCKRDLRDEFSMVVDIEHVLPKSVFPNLIFDLDNLSVSCKRCNMEIKRSRVDFIVNLNNVTSNFTDPLQYKFIHPNLDDYFVNMDYSSTTINNKKFTKYKYKTAKGLYSYKYFELDQIEINNINWLQGFKHNIEQASVKLNIRLRELIKKL